MQIEYLYRRCDEIYVHAKVFEIRELIHVFDL